MNDWQLKKIGEISKTTAGGTPSTDTPEYWNNGTIPWMSSGEIHFKRISNVAKKISELGFKNSSAKLLPPKTILIALAGQGKTRGTVAISEIELTTNQSVAGILVRNESVLPDYVFHNLNNRYEELRNISTGGGREGLNLEIINGIEILLPPLPEQSKIAEILSTVDQVIELTEKEISRLEDLKKGMMNDLFTKGIGHTKFKDSPIGKIPESWAITPMGQLFTNSKDKGFSGIETGSITSKEGLVSRSSVDRRVASELLPEEHLYARKGYLAYNMMRMWQGVVGYANQDFLVSPAYVVLKPKNEVNSLFYYYLFKTHKWIQFFHNYSIGVTDDRLRLYFHDFARIPAVFPPSQEQSVITNKFLAIENVLVLKNLKLESAIKLKKSLMNDLLTGKVRVKV